MAVDLDEVRYASDLPSVDVELREIPPIILATFGVCIFWALVFMVYLVFAISAPVPKAPREADKTYSAVFSDQTIHQNLKPTSWFDRWRAIRVEAKERRKAHPAYPHGQIDQGQMLLSVVVPAFNEEDRLGAMLEETVRFLRSNYDELYTIAAKGRNGEPESTGQSTALKERGSTNSGPSDTETVSDRTTPHGWEIIVVSDGSKDRTVDVALAAAGRLGLFDDAMTSKGPSSHFETLRVISLRQNRGKGGAVRHGMKFVRGQYALFADADGASPFENVTSLLERCVGAADRDGRSFAVGSRAHLVTTEPVVQRSAIRNFLMRSFHVVLRTLTPPETSAIRDTQCGFKMLSRPALPFIIPFIHFEGWIFDVEMLMLAESAGIPMREIPVKGWREVEGSKLNVLFDSVEMAWNLVVLRGAWMLNLYSNQ